MELLANLKWNKLFHNHLWVAIPDLKWNLLHSVISLTKTQVANLRRGQKLIQAIKGDCVVIMIFNFLEGFPFTDFIQLCNPTDLVNLNLLLWCRFF